jgi:spermidine/putrescine transport system permease protein
MIRQYGDRAAAYLLTAPALLFLLLLFVAPLATVAATSMLRAAPDGTITSTLTIDNYRNAFHPVYVGVLLRSVVLAFLTTAFALVLAYPCALALRSMTPRRRMLALAVIVLPSWLNLLVKNYAWIVILRREGVLNTFLQSIGIIDAPLTLLFNDAAVLIGLVHTYLPFMILPLFAAVDKMDMTLVDAARDLGAGAWQRFRLVVVPQTRAGVAAGSVLVFIPALGAFVTPDLLGGTRSLMLANLIEAQVLQARNWPFAAAISMFAVVLVLLAAIMLRRVTRDAEELVP